MSVSERTLGRLKGVDLIFDDHGPMLSGAFEYEGAWNQGFGWVVDLDFVLGLMRACGVYRLQDCNGRVVWVTCDHTKIHLIEPLGFPSKTDYAQPFDIDAWSEKKRAAGAVSHASTVTG